MQSKYSRQLTEEQVAEILNAPFAMRHADLAKRYGVAPSTIARIRHGLTWASQDKTTVQVKLPSETANALKRKAKLSEATLYEIAERVLVNWASRQK